MKYTQQYCESPRAVAQAVEDALIRGVRNITVRVSVNAPTVVMVEEPQRVERRARCGNRRSPGAGRRLNDFDRRTPTSGSIGRRYGLDRRAA